MFGNRSDSLRLITDPIGWLKDTLGRIGLEGFARRFYGVYPGVVVSNADPDNRGRIQALCPAVGLNTVDQIGPSWWALPSMPGLSVDPTTKQASGIFYPPDVDSQVWMMFQHGDPEFPVYIGGYMAAGKASDTFDAENALRKGFRTSTGHYLRMSDDPEDLHLILGKGDGSGGPSPAFLTIDKDGSVLLTNEKGSMLFMNATTPETSLMTANDDGEVTAMLMLGDDKITLATKSGGAIGISGKDITLTGDNVVADASKQFVANAGAVYLGKGASEPAVRGNKLTVWALAHQHVCAAPGSPTTPGPLPPPMLYKELSEIVFIR